MGFYMVSLHKRERGQTAVSTNHVEAPRMLPKPKFLAWCNKYFRGIPFSMCTNQLFAGVSFVNEAHSLIISYTHAVSFSALCSHIT